MVGGFSKFAPVSQSRGFPRADRHRFLRTACACRARRHLLSGRTRAHAEDFYKDKTLTIVAGFSPARGYDSYARALARHIGKHIPGNPSVIVQNMPGAGSLTAVRYLDATAPKDGTVLTIFNPGLVTQSLVEPDKVDVDFRNYAWIGVVTPRAAQSSGWRRARRARWRLRVVQQYSAGLGPQRLGAAAAAVSPFGQFAVLH